MRVAALEIQGKHRGARSGREPLRPTALDRLNGLIALLGKNQAALVLGIDRSQLSQIARCKERPGPDLTLRIINSDFVMARASQAFHLDEIGPWLTSPEPLLGGSIPLNVLLLHGPSRVVDAIEARACGAFA